MQDGNNNNNKNGANKNKKNNDDRMVLKALAMLTQLGLQMASCIIVGAVIGIFLDRITGLSPLFMIIFIVLGSAASIKVLYDIGKDWK